MNPRDPRLLLAGAAAAWMAYEAVMAVVLRGEFMGRDWAALAVKLAYLAGLLASSTRGPREAALYAAALGPGAAAAVRATQGWLGYMWFTVFVPLLGFGAAAWLASKRVQWAAAALAVNAAAAAYHGVTLVGKLYEAPERIVAGDIVAFGLLVPVSGLLVQASGRAWWHIVLLVGVAAVLYSLLGA